MKKGGLTVEGVAAKLRELSGNMAAVARSYGVTRQAVWDFCRTRPALLAVSAECRESMIDHAESALYRAVIAGDAWAVCFFLKTQGRTRGYIDRERELPPLEVLLGALPESIRKTVRAALSEAVHGGGNPTGRQSGQRKRPRRPGQRPNPPDEGGRAHPRPVADEAHQAPGPQDQGAVYPPLGEDPDGGVSGNGPLLD